jgi:hypothetical protein
MTLYDHNAIHRAYPNDFIEVIDDVGIFKADTNQTEKFIVDQSKIDAARIEINTEVAANKYKTDRTINGSTTYASFGDQLDMLYKDIVTGKLDTTGTWATHIKAVKDANPKP